MELDPGVSKFFASYQLNALDDRVILYQLFF